MVVAVAVSLCGSVVCWSVVCCAGALCAANASESAARVMVTSRIAESAVLIKSGDTLGKNSVLAKRQRQLIGNVGVHQWKRDVADMLGGAWGEHWGEHKRSS